LPTTNFQQINGWGMPALRELVLNSRYTLKS
jgi:hypothetical protein